MTVIYRHPQVVIRTDSSRIDGDRFLRPDSKAVKEKGLVPGHAGIRQPSFWCSSEERASTVWGAGYVKS